MKTTQKPDKDKAVAATERRRGSQDAINKMVAERAEMLSLYWRLAGVETSSGEHNHRGEPLQKLLQEFCQILVDYIAAGHFSLYERIVNGTERRREVATLASELYPRISDTTALALDFNDKYDCGENGTIPESFQADLSRLGEELALRIELEDKLISRLVS
jgi:regulator of sigma D